MKLNGIFKNDMVFQRDREIRVFGETESVTSVTAVLKDESGEIITKGTTNEIYDDGFFLVVMPALRAGGPYVLEVREGKKRKPEITISNIYIGEVWLAAGQSNMEYPLGRSEHASRVIMDLPETNIHFYNIPVAGNYDADQALMEEQSQWSIINKDTCFDMSAVAFYFARRIETFIKEHHVEGMNLHFGIIGCYLGGTSLASWQTIESLESTKEGCKYLQDYSDEIAAIPEKFRAGAIREYDEKVAKYNKRLKTILDVNPYVTYGEAERILDGVMPWPPPATPESIRRPGALFDTMLLRIVPYGIRGVILYQGETDADDHAEDYSVVFKTFIEEWRETFWDENLPFIFCQLPMYISKDRKYMGFDDMKWPKLREQQALVARTVPNTYMAALTDCGEFNNLHPSDKRTPGERMANLALHFIYGYEGIPAVAPYVIDVRRGDGVEISFAGDFNHLNLISGYSSEESGFEVAGKDGVFYPAEASIDFDGKTVLCSCRKVERAYKVRYAYFSYGMANLVSDTGLAAEPFQADIDNTIGEFY